MGENALLKSSFSIFASISARNSS